MKVSSFIACFIIMVNYAIAQKQKETFPTNQISINAFRNPSIGLEYQHKEMSFHAGYYITNFESNTTTEFFKVGANYWLLPWGKNSMPSSFYIGTSYLRGLTREYKDENAIAFETGTKIAIWKGLHFRLGVIAITSENEDLKINPTPSINYSFTF